MFVALEEFRAGRRHVALDSYLPVFNERKHQPHRYLFTCYVYQHHLTQMGAIVVEWTKRLNGSSHAWKMNFGHHTHAEAVAALRYVRVWTSGSDVNPNQYIFYPFSCMLTNGWVVVGVVPGAQPMHGDLGIARRHDPVALPPRNVLEWCRNCISMRLKLDCLPLYFVFHHF